MPCQAISIEAVARSLFLKERPKTAVQTPTPLAEETTATPSSEDTASELTTAIADPRETTTTPQSSTARFRTSTGGGPGFKVLSGIIALLGLGVLLRHRRRL